MKVSLQSVGFDESERGKRARGEVSVGGSCEGSRATAAGLCFAYPNPAACKQHRMINNYNCLSILSQADTSLGLLF